MKIDFTQIANVPRLQRLLRTTGIFFPSLCILLSISFVSVLAQPYNVSFNNHHEEAIHNPFLDERVLLITDRKLYLCGENIVFEAFTCEGNWFLPIVFSSIIYVELYSQDNIVISRGKFSMKDGRGEGFISIPREINSDIYHIRAYTNYMKNFGIRQFFIQKLKILNPFQNSGGIGLLPRSVIDTTIDDDIDDDDPLNKLQLETFGINLKTDKKAYGNRENIEVMVSAISKERLPVVTNLILFAYLADTSFNEMPKQHKPVFSPGSKPVTNLPEDLILNYLPEIRGDIVSGKVIYKNNLPAKGMKLIQSFTGNTTSIESSVTDSNGKFYFLTDARNNYGDLIIKVQNTDSESSVILDDEFFRDFPPPTKEKLILHEDETDLISRQFINIQVDDAFSAKIGNKTANIVPEIHPFYANEFVEYKFPDYIKLPNMKEFIFEVIQGVILSREKGNQVLYILDEDNFEKLGPNPLIIIDGVPVTESSVVTGFPSEKVKYIRVVRHRYFYKDQIFDGIFDITTNSHNAKDFIFPKGTYRYSFIHTSLDKISVESKLATDTAGRIPVYKNLLYWNSNVIADKNGNARITFISPDNRGTYEIRCFCITDEGIAGEGRITIQVGK